MGCREITPHLVGLAKRLEGKPFHLIASHCQNTSSRKEVIAYLRANGFSGTSPNMTITKQGRHPDVPGNGYVPYYIVFDHTGKLRHHHMCGNYHGGDGFKMIEWVDKLLKDAPAVWLGKAPYDKHAKLASKIASGKSLGGSIKKLEALRANPDAQGQDELTRMHKALVTWRDRKVADATGLETSQPSEVIPQLKAVQKLVKGTSLAGPVDEALAEASDSESLKIATAHEKAFRKIVKAYEKVKESKRTEKLTDRTIAKLEALLEEASGSTFSAAIEDYLSNFR